MVEEEEMVGEDMGQRRPRLSIACIIIVLIIILITLRLTSYVVCCFCLDPYCRPVGGGPPRILSR